MELFQRAKAVRLKSHHDKYLFADDDELRVTQDRDGASPNARWAVEHVPVPSGDGDGAGGGGHRVFRLRSRYGKYLTASNEPFLLGMTGRKVLQTKPERLDSAVEWEPEREGFQARLKTRYGHYLRANGGLPPWRNSVTHDVPHRTATQDWVLWDVEILEINVPSPAPAPAVVAAAPSSSPNPPPQAKLSKLESSDSFATPLHKVDSRVIYYHVADDKGHVDDGIEGHSFIFNGTSLEELTHKLEEETGLSDIIVCSKSPLDGKLHPLRLQLPPNNAAMHIVLVRENSKVAKTFP